MNNDWPVLTLRAVVAGLLALLTVFFIHVISKPVGWDVTATVAVVALVLAIYAHLMRADAR